MSRRVASKLADGDTRRALQILTSDDTYQMNVVIFGTKSLPCTATYVLRRCADGGMQQHPLAASNVYTRFYVDDNLDSVDTEKEGRELVNSLTTLLSADGFHLTKWTSTSVRCYMIFR